MQRVSFGETQQGRPTRFDMRRAAEMGSGGGSQGQGRQRSSKNRKDEGGGCGGHCSGAINEPSAHAGTTRCVIFCSGVQSRAKIHDVVLTKKSLCV